MSLIDKINIELAAGSGGDGVVRWRREKFIPKGGPAGGDGGRGGSVYIKGVKDNTLLERYVGKNKLTAEDGQPGGSKSLYGEAGEDLVVEVPIGTVVTNTTKDKVIDVLDTEPQLILKGGKGGLGNIHFKSSTNQTPKQYSEGVKGEAGDFVFELKLIADAGLVGLPNAGKSSLLNSITNAKSKVGDYHFTTLEPHLGKLYEYILADIPGLISGASEGKGLGHKFLQHIERTKVIFHCLACDSDDIKRDYEAIRTELEQYSANLADKPEQIILTKVDKASAEELADLKHEYPNAFFTTILDDDVIKDTTDEMIKFLRQHGQ